MAKIDAFFNLMFEQNASDLHLATGNPPILRIRGELQRVDFPPWKTTPPKAILTKLPPEKRTNLSEKPATADLATKFPNFSASAPISSTQRTDAGAISRKSQ